MKIAQVQFSPWDKTYNFDPNNLVLVEGDYVVVKTDTGKDLGKIISFSDFSDDDFKKNEKGELEYVGKINSKKESQESEDDKIIKLIISKATSHDLEKIPGKKEKKEALDYCKKMVDKNKMAMKIIDVHFSFDGSKITFAFIADGRIDFRELVKDLTKNFNRTIRLHQIGIRDESKIMGDCGPCGRVLCCKKFLTSFSSITSDMAEIQQVSHRGSERISGICGRLMCCLGYEEKGYREMAETMPPIGKRVSVDGKRGIVLRRHILKQSVDVEFPDENGDGKSIIEIDLNRNKK